VPAKDLRKRASHTAFRTRVTFERLNGERACFRYMYCGDLSTQKGRLEKFATATIQNILP